MKKILFSIIVLVCTLTAYAQQGKDEYKSMIDSAINIMYNRYSTIPKKQNDDDYLNNLYLFNEQNLPLNYIPSSSKFKIINLFDDRNIKLLTKGIYAWKVLATLNKNSFKITIINFFITYKKHNLNFANGGGSESAFEYDCDKNEWRLISFENSGI